MPRIFNKFTEGLLTDQLVFLVRFDFVDCAMSHPCAAYPYEG